MSASKRPIESYEHRDKQRVNNPPVGKPSYSPRTAAFLLVWVRLR